MKIYSFPYISSPDATTLILGTMPGQRSLAMKQYYGHAGNAFWKILFETFDGDFTNDYEQRIKLLLNNKVAVWDVLCACDREGSADSAIEKEVVNDFDQFFKDHPKIRRIAFNGNNAENYYIRHVRNRPDIPTFVLPSTSSANSWLKFEEKLEKWKRLLHEVQ
jgi:hypoxanthine-DNA glycosylase